MKKGRFTSLLRQRIFIVISVAGLSGIFMALYYFVYAPHQHVFFNEGAFRTLSGISQNFKYRVQTYDLNRSKEFQVKETDALVSHDLSSSTFQQLKKKVSTPVRSIYTPTLKNRNSFDRDTASIIGPIVSIRNTLFESVILLRKLPNDSALILYKSGSLNMDDVIRTDSLFKITNGFTFPKIADVEMEGVQYKLFLFPFRINKQLFFLGGFINDHDYHSSAGNFPMSYLVAIALLIIVVLTALPFFKIFLIGSFENISINDVRAIIAMIFVAPFLFILFNWAFWISKAEDKKSDGILAGLHQEVSACFYNEIEQIIKQLNGYDSLYTGEGLSYDSFRKKLEGQDGRKESFRDVFFYPGNYKNIDDVFWLSRDGEEVLKWNFLNKPTVYLNKAERQYFKDIQKQEGYLLPGTGSDTFSIQPTISSLTGDYTVNIVKHSRSSFGARDQIKPVLIGLSGKLYSVYEPVVAKGFNFCIINAKGEIQYHSESSRSLQENILNEASSNQPLKAAIADRDSLLIDGLGIYGKNVKMLISPMKGLPYYLVTYYDKRDQNLFTLHIIAFTFFCEGLVLLALSLFMLFFYSANQKFTELFFSRHGLEWIRPSALKKNYYLLMICYQSALLFILFLSAGFIAQDQLFNYLLDISLLMPFFAVMGYYLFRSAERNAIDYIEIKEKDTALLEAGWKDNLAAEELREMRSQLNGAHFKAYRNLIVMVLKVMMPFAAMMFLISVFKAGSQETEINPEKAKLDQLILFLKIYIPTMGVILSFLWQYMLINKSAKPEVKKGVGTGKSPYMLYFMASLTLSILLITILPTFGFLLYANKQELSLQVKSNQLNLARRIQGHRKLVNDKVDSEKHLNFPSLAEGNHDYASKMKFDRDYGLYLGSTALEPVKTFSDVNGCSDFISYPFYKWLTNYLFLPADHFDRFNNNPYYYWKLCQSGNQQSKTLRLFYANSSEARDYRDTSSFILSSASPSLFPFISQLNDREKMVQVGSVILLILGLIRLALSATRRIFLIGYFEKSPGMDQNFSVINRVFESVTLEEPEKVFWNAEHLSLAVIQNKENIYPSATRQYAECILKIQTNLGSTYEKIWKSCNLPEQSVLYDFALDGFTNYRNVNILFPLYERGILKKTDFHLKMMTDSFRNFLISKTGSSEINELQQSVSAGGKWGNLTSLFYILLFATILFLFFIQEEVSNRLIAIVTSLGALIPLMLKLFNSPAPKKQDE